MRRSWIGGLAAVLVALGIVAAVCLPARGANFPFAGTWELEVFGEGQTYGLALIRVEQKDGKPRASLLASLPPLEKATVENVSADAHSLHFTLKSGDKSIAVAAYLPPGEKKPQALLGSWQLGGQYQPLQLEKTERTRLDAKESARPVPGADEVKKAQQKADPGERAEALKEVQKKYAGKPAALMAAGLLLPIQLQRGAPDDEVRAAADGYVKGAADYGRDFERQAVAQVAGGLTTAGKDPRLALTYARRAAKEVRDDDPPARSVTVLRILEAALRRAGRTDEIKQVRRRIARLDEELDKEFLRTAVPFPVEPAARKGKSGRVALLELFTGAQCGSCVAAEVAFNALLRAYKPADLVLIQYHLHARGPDALANPDARARARFYGIDADDAPSAFLDGRDTPSVSGIADQAKKRYDTLRRLIDEALDTQPQARLRLEVGRKGDRLELRAEVSGLKKVGDNVRLRFVLVEEVVRYPGVNGQRLHQHVVRAFPGGVRGTSLEETTKPTATVDLAELRKELTDYLDRAGKDQPLLNQERPLDLKRLAVVAFVQDDQGKKVLQAARADVPGEK